MQLDMHRAKPTAAVRTTLTDPEIKRMAEYVYANALAWDERPRYGRDEMKRMEAERCGAHRRRHRIRSSLRIFRDGSVRGAAVAARPKISRWRSDDTEARGECHQHKAGADAGILQPFRGFL
jgi:hypothetical protein